MCRVLKRKSIIKTASWSLNVLLQNHHCHIVLLARISLTLSHHPSLSSSLQADFPGYILCHPRFRQVFLATSYVRTEVLWISSCWSFYSPEPVLDFGSERGSEKEQWQLRLGYLRVGELYYRLLLTNFGSSGSHYTKWADEQHRPVGFELRLVPDLPLLLSPL